MYRLWFSSVFFVLNLFSISSREVLAEAASSCPKPTSPKEVLRCALTFSPQAQRSEFEVERARAGVDVAAQIPNPTFSVQSGFLSFSGENRGDHQFSLVQSLDWGGKRGARKREAEAQRRIADVERSRSVAELAQEIGLRLQRLRQLGAEIHTLEEASGMFEKFAAFFQKRPSLTPEQQVSVSVFRMAREDLRLRRSALAEEEQSLAAFFEVNASLSLDSLKNALPKPIETWPDVPGVGSETPDLSPVLRRAREGVSLSQAQLESARAAAWPELSLGPYAFAQKDGASTSSLYGFMVNLEIPIFSLNGAGRAAARQNLLFAEKEVTLARRETASLRARLVETYRAAVNALKSTPSLSQREKEHLSTERQLLRGVVPSSLVIESHRQLIDLQKNTHERELKALEALGQLRILAGRPAEEIL